MIPKSVRDAIFAGRQKPDYARIRVPALASLAMERAGGGVDQSRDLLLAEDARQQHTMEALVIPRFL